MQSTATKSPARLRTIPKARTKRKNDGRVSAANLARRCGAQTLAAWAGEIATKTPSATATALRQSWGTALIVCKFVR